ncbi:MAG: hypothetical protein IJ928_11305 [Prevotella sp.]|nr:hypothetical protein [Prevotella sp.]
MKKILALTLLLAAMVATAHAQDVDETACFADQNGNIIPNGTEINASTVYEDLMGIQIKSGLFVKNTGDEDVLVRIAVQVTELSSGQVQICFPNMCIPITAPGELATNAANVAAGALTDLETEWNPADFAYGTARATYKIQYCSFNSLTQTYNVVEEGPQVTVCYNYQDPSAIQQAKATEAATVATYNTAGQRTGHGQKGLVIVKKADGTTSKHLAR